MFDYLSDLGVDGHTITPGYEYDAAKKDMIKRLNLRPENFFLTRTMTIEKFQKVEKWMSRYTFLGTPIYFEFLAGKRDLTCSARRHLENSQIQFRLETETLWPW